MNKNLLIERYSQYDILTSKIIKDLFSFTKEKFQFLNNVDENDENLKKDLFTEQNLYFFKKYEFPKLGLKDRKPTVQIQFVISYNPNAAIKKDRVSWINKYGYAILGEFLPFVKRLDGGHIDLHFVVANFNHFQSVLNWQAVYFRLLTILRHEIEHVIQFTRSMALPVHHFDLEAEIINRKKEVEFLKTNKDANKVVRYLTIFLSEIEAELKALYFISKKKKVSLSSEINDRLDSLNLNKKDQKIIKTAWRNYAKKYFPYLKF